MNYLQKIIGEIETHSVEGIRDCFENGVHPNDLYNGLPLIYELTSEYLRSNRFKQCVQLFVEYGLIFEDGPLLFVLLDDATSLQKELERQPQLLSHTFTLRSAFTPLEQVSLLHICAEFNHIACAEKLVKHGADINAKAGYDAWGFGGQTPIFHTVNQIRNQSFEMLQFLLEHNANLDDTVKGLIWGKSYEWETFIPSVNPISYAMMGLLPQVHRKDTDIADIISRLLQKAHGIHYNLPNIPNKYLRS